MEFEQSIRKELYTLVGLALAVSTFSSVGAITIYKLDKMTELVEKEHEKRIAFLESTIHSRSQMDTMQNHRIERIEDAIYEFKPTYYSYQTLEEHKF